MKIGHQASDNAPIVYREYADYAELFDYVRKQDCWSRELLHVPYKKISQMPAQVYCHLRDSGFKLD